MFYNIKQQVNSPTKPERERYGSRLTHWSMRGVGLMLGICCSVSSALAQRGLRDVPDPDPAKQLNSFQVAEGFEVNLFASEPLIAKPIQMNWDGQGRLWVATSETYPQIKPGEVANDKIIVLEDTTGDGVADKQTVFAEGLLMPTAILPGDGGVYVGASTELLHLSDTTGDGRADRRRIVLSGFGTEDTHHMIHTLRRGPTGHIYFNQSIYTHSHLETPYGVKRLLAGGTWKMQPRTLELEVFTRGLVNPWGLVFDPWGQAFETDGAGGEGIHYVFPDVVMLTAHNAERIVRGLNPGQPKHCGLELLSGDQLPAGWAGRLVTNDFRGNRINSFELSPSGSGYVSVRQENLLASNHVAFRPVDILMGPDGAIYVADWYNPIIQHGEVDFRDERRDREHGRIWRIAPKGQQAAPRPVPAEATVGELFGYLESSEKWWRDAARAELVDRAQRTDEMAEKLREQAREWTAQQQGQAFLEGLWLQAALDAISWEQLDQALTAEDARLRAAGVRLLEQMPEQAEVLSRLQSAIDDELPQVRLEALHGLRRVRTPEALLAATRACTSERDGFLDFSLWQTFRDTEGIWLPELKNNPAWQALPVATLLQLSQSARSPTVINPLLERWRAGELPEEYLGELLRQIVQQGQPEHVQFVWETALSRPEQDRPPLLQALATLAERRNLLPQAEERERLQEWVAAGEVVELRRESARLAGFWKLRSAAETLRGIVESSAEPLPLRQTALESLARMGGQQELIQRIAGGELLPELRLPALEALAGHDLNLAAQATVKWLGTLKDAGRTERILNPLLNRKEGPAALTKALRDATLSTEVAVIGARRAGGVSPRHEPLIEAFQQAGKLQAIAKTMTDEQYRELAEATLKTGNRDRGELIYRRENLQCIKCHAIGGAGGKVGPDLTSIGASAPVDYLIESLIEPDKKIKEGYHTLQIVTDEGIVKNGVAVLENEREVHLRNAEGKVEVIPTEEIELRRISPTSLMPAELVTKLPTDELLDLSRFLAALGKTGELVVGGERYVRTWEVLHPGDQRAAVNDTLRHHGPEYAVKQDSGLPWKTEYSFVEGYLPVNDLVPMGNVDGRALRFARFEVEVIRAGDIGFQFPNPQGLRMWVGSQEVDVEERTAMSLPVGRHRITLAIDSSRRPQPRLFVELIDLPNSSGQASLVN